jgi:hypothetical protein
MLKSQIASVAMHSIAIANQITRIDHCFKPVYETVQKVRDLPSELEAEEEIHLLHHKIHELKEIMFV